MVQLALSVSANLASFRQAREVAEAGVGCDLYILAGLLGCPKEPELHLVGTESL